ncbi:MAG: RES family NAD+ phosphorylase [Flavobacteriales bacterium]|nr:RES family NAD+ phosphorylase [Flavobacteriales bacterium]
MIGTVENINLKINVNSTFLRARPNHDQPRFEKKEDLSIKPSRYNTDYLRASTPLKTMFYSVYMSGNNCQNDYDIMRITGVYETIPEIRIPHMPYSGKITFGYWTNCQSLNLMAIMHKDLYATRNPYTKEIIDSYNQHLSNCDSQLIQKSLLFYDFLADEFSKETIRGNYDYMISALFSEAASRFNIDGIIYPSVRLGGMSYNVALNQSAMKKLKLNSVEEASVEQIDNNVRITVNAFVKLKENETNFTLTDVPLARTCCPSYYSQAKTANFVTSGSI